jgi:hypothetical protein
MQSLITESGRDVPGQPRPEARSALDEVRELVFSFDPTRSPAVMVERLTGLLRTTALVSVATLVHVLGLVERMIQQFNYAPQVADSILQLMEAIAAQARKQLADLLRIDEKLQWKTDIIDIVLAIAVGLYRDRVLLSDRGLDSINHLDYRAWLAAHGASKSALESPFLTGIYDLVFAYRKGDRNDPQLAAGVALRGALRMFFTYRGSMFWRMRSGMGDAVFAPLYRVLQLSEWKRKDESRSKSKSTGKNSNESNNANKGNDGPPLKRSPVTFHFLHHLDGIKLEDVDGERYVTRLRFRVNGDRAEVDACSRDALDPESGTWPRLDPRYEAAGATKDWSTATSFELAVGAESDGFEAVVLALDGESFRAVCERPYDASRHPGLLRQLPGYANMMRNTATVATTSLQVWLKQDLEDLGWYRGPGLITAMGAPYDTWADMTQTLDAEARWRSQHPIDPTVDAELAAAYAELDAARSVAYFCGVLADPAPAAGGAPAIGEMARDEFDRDERVPGPMPGQGAAMDVAARAFTVDAWAPGHASLVVDWAKPTEALLKAAMYFLWPYLHDQSFPQYGIDAYAVANVEGAARYTLSLPGSIDSRISPLDRSVANMTIAGDWTACGLDAGCMESAVMSGMLAAHALSGAPEFNDIVGFDHP